MVITQKFEDLSYFAPGVEQADLRKSEIVRDMLRVMNEAPFWGLQANGEPNVSCLLSLSPPPPLFCTPFSSRVPLFISLRIFI
ncbi:hypothetical protein M440DRAFT_1208473 [Trichoderma longibrachiatum ATCC 18648]|uniref:Uncharacterized protein n=1 Tax=Trichoderma longibrachiatum ATCC 18648 TaxID=983965 RepID=A0A2T4C6U3_TRILO|nr:hypothetical protein M440DRAFT_1208473 [Trichoderma longibrachiatum ATCC 18648]